MNKFLPEGFNEFKQLYDQDKEKSKQKSLKKMKKPRGFKLGKDVDRQKIRELKDKIKVPKAHRTKLHKKTRVLKWKLRRLHKQVITKRTKEKKKGVRGPTQSNRKK